MKKQPVVSTVLEIDHNRLQNTKMMFRGESSIKKPQTYHLSKIINQQKEIKAFAKPLTE